MNYPSGAGRAGAKKLCRKHGHASNHYDCPVCARSNTPSLQSQLEDADRVIELMKRRIRKLQKAVDAAKEFVNLVDTSQMNRVEKKAYERLDEAVADTI